MASETSNLFRNTRETRAARAAELAREKEEFKRNLPKLLLELVAEANQLGKQIGYELETQVTTDNTGGVVVNFRFPVQYIFSTYEDSVELSYKSQEYEVINIRERLNEFRIRYDAEQARQARTLELWRKLKKHMTDEELAELELKPSLRDGHVVRAFFAEKRGY